MDGGITVKDQIEVETNLGIHTIELCHGDITALKLEERVDILMVSAFLGDYATVKGTLIGALWKNLRIKVENLAKDKEMDLRVHFSCWLSKKLPDDEVPFGRILCFEMLKTGVTTIVEEIRKIFRVLVPVFKNQETTIITPLLATGNQGKSKTDVLSATVESAISWIQAGLPLKKMKIVLFKEPDDSLDLCFEKIKKRYKAKEYKMKKAMKEYDIFLGFEPKDSSYVNKFSSALVKKHKGLKVFSKEPKFDKAKVWQQNIFDLMLGSQRIVMLLTPSFVNSKQCLEMFNMAICCTRHRKTDVLVPIYLINIESLPVNVSLVQFFDCRIRKETDTFEIKLDSACNRILSFNSEIITTETEDIEHDVFISYAHKDPTEATNLLSEFERNHKDIKVFFDRQDLSIGGSWQKSIYNSLDIVKCVIALVSPNYVTSVVCQEEYNIALYRSLSKKDKMLLIPVCIEDMADIPTCFSYVKLLDGRSGRFHDMIPELAKDVSQWVKGREMSTNLKSIQLQKKPNLYNFQGHREDEFRSAYQFKADGIERKIGLEKKSIPKSDCHVAISVSQDDHIYAQCLAYLLQQGNPDINITYLTDNTGKDLHCLQTAKIIVIFLSSLYLKSPFHLEELFVSIIRQRNEKQRQVIHICQTDLLPQKPTFPRLLTQTANLTDDFWKKILAPFKSKGWKKVIKSDTPGFVGSFYVEIEKYIEMTKVADDVLMGLSEDKLPLPIIQNVVLPENDKAMLSPLDKCLVNSNKNIERNNRENDTSSTTIRTVKESIETNPSINSQKVITSSAVAPKSEVMNSTHHAVTLDKVANTSDENKKETSENEEDESNQKLHKKDDLNGMKGKSASSIDKTMSKQSISAVTPKSEVTTSTNHAVTMEHQVANTSDENKVETAENEEDKSNQKLQKLDNLNDIKRKSASTTDKTTSKQSKSCLIL